MKIPDYKAQWRDIVMAYVKVLNATGYISKLVNSDKINLYLDIFAKKSDPDADTLQEGIQIKDELEKIRKAKIAVEKQRFPFEDYDPERGTRYVGNRLIPWDAPPRPDNHSVWDEDDCKWVDPEVLDARRAAGFARLEAMMAEMPLMTSSRLKSLSLALTGRRFHIRPLPGVLPRAGISPGLQPAFSGISERHGRK